MNAGEQDWSSWAETQRAGSVARFIVDILNRKDLGKWLDPNKGIFELTNWKEVAIQWHEAKAHRSKREEAPVLLHRALSSALPGISVLRERSVRDRNVFQTKVYQCSEEIVKEVMQCQATERQLEGRMEPAPFRDIHGPLRQRSRPPTTTPAVESTSTLAVVGPPLDEATPPTAVMAQPSHSAAPPTAVVAQPPPTATPPTAVMAQPPPSATLPPTATAPPVATPTSADLPPTPISEWLATIKLGDYREMLQSAGYNTTDFLIGITADDLIQLGMSKIGHRSRLLNAMQSISAGDRQPKCKPVTVSAWLTEIGLQQYESVLVEEGFDEITYLTDITVKELREVGITKQGHVKKFIRSLAILRQLQEGRIVVEVQGNERNYVKEINPVTQFWIPEASADATYSIRNMD